MDATGGPRMDVGMNTAPACILVLFVSISCPVK